MFYASFPLISSITRMNDRGLGAFPCLRPMLMLNCYDIHPPLMTLPFVLSHHTSIILTSQQCCHHNVSQHRIKLFFQVAKSETHAPLSETLLFFTRLALNYLHYPSNTLSNSFNTFLSKVLSRVMYITFHNGMISLSATQYLPFWQNMSLGASVSN